MKTRFRSSNEKIAQFLTRAFNALYPATDNRKIVTGGVVRPSDRVPEVVAVSRTAGSTLVAAVLLLTGQSTGARDTAIMEKQLAISKHT